MMRMQTIFREKRRRIGEVTGYTAFYLLSFFLLEQRSVRYVLLDTVWDRRIPFCEYFILPYGLWFFFIAGTVAWFTLFCDSDGDYFRLSRSLALGCTVFLAVSALFPNGQQLRPALVEDGTLFLNAVRLLYRFDTPTNVFPSIHVFNSVVCCEAIFRQNRLRRHPLLIGSTLLLTLLIIASTLLLKQHTLLDVTGGLLLAGATSRIFYGSRVNHPKRVPQRLSQRQFVP